MAIMSGSRRVRRTVFSSGVEAQGVKAYTVYNRMLLPTMFESVEFDYHHLKSDVQIWDVACERQVQIKGPHAAALLQKLTPRDLTKLDPTRCMYIPICNRAGGMLNDPVVLKVAHDTFWISIADSDLGMWVEGVATANGYDVEVSEPEISPLGIQGPRSNELAARIFGDEVRSLGFFRVMDVTFDGVSMKIARSGYSKQGGFEIYVPGSEVAMPLWNALFTAGENLNVRPGCPNLIERIEGGLLSYGNDITEEDSPLQAGFGRYVSDSQLDHCYGGGALRKEREHGIQRQITAVALHGDIPASDRAWPIYKDGARVGQVTSAARSPDFGTNVAIAMVDTVARAPGTAIEVETQDGMRNGVVKDKFWI